MEEKNEGSGAGENVIVPGAEDELVVPTNEIGAGDRSAGENKFGAEAENVLPINEIRAENVVPINEIRAENVVPINENRAFTSTTLEPVIYKPEYVSTSTSSTRETLTYNFNPITDLIGRLQAKLISIDAEYEAKISEANRIAEEKRIKEAADSRQREEALTRQRAEEEKRAAERAIKFEQNEALRREKQAELLRLQKAEEERQRLQKEEETRLRKLEEEKRFRKVEEERLRREEAERLQRAAEDREREERANAFKNERIAKITDIKKLSERIINIIIPNNDRRETILSNLQEIITTLKTKQNKEELDLYLSSNEYKNIMNNVDEFIKQSPTTYGEFKSKNIDKIVNLSHIFKYKESYDKKPKDQQDQIVSALNQQLGGDIGTQFNTILNDNEIKDQYLIKLNNIEYDKIIIEVDERTLTEKLNNFNKKFNNIFKPAMIQEIYEILGAARVLLNMKPKGNHGNAPNKNNRFDISGVSQMSSSITSNSKGGGLVQSGGYSYSDVITIDGKTKRVTISNLCKPFLDNMVVKSNYGPFAAIYPPQYNNSHIYGSMFGSNTLAELYEDPTKSTLMNFPKESFNLKNGGVIPSGSELLNGNSPEELQYQDLMKKLARDGNVIIFGYGFSGSGKTYLLIDSRQKYL